MWECSSFISISSSEGQDSFYGSTPPGTALWRQARHVSTWASSNRKLAYSPECVERLSEKGYKQHSGGEFGWCRAGEIGRNTPLRRPGELRCRLLQGFSDSLSTL